MRGHSFCVVCAALAVDAAAEGADSGVLPYLSQVLGSQAESIRSIEERTRELERQLEAMQASQRA